MGDSPQCPMCSAGTLRRASDEGTTTFDAIAERVVDELEARGLVLPAERAPPAESPVEARDQAMGLATPKQIATDLGISRRTVHRRINEWDLVRRDAEGYPKKKEGGTTYISRTAWQKRGPLATQTVRRLAGLS